LKDEPLRLGQTILSVHKRRFWCRARKKPFTEPLPGVRKGYRTTERYRRRVLWACEHFVDLKSVRETYRCSSGLVLEQRRLVTMVVDHENKRLMELVEGKSGAGLTVALQHIPGRENVRWVTLDMSDSYRSFARSFFPNAQLVADKFHVLRLLTPAIHRALRALNLPKEALPMYRVLHKNPRTLTAKWRWNLRVWLADTLALSKLPELATFRNTLMRWRKEVLAYFLCRLTNARTEGFNGKAKLVIRRAYGYKSFRNYRLRLLSSCA